MSAPTASKSQLIVIFTTILHQKNSGQGLKMHVRPTEYCEIDADGCCKTSDTPSLIANVLQEGEEGATETLAVQPK